MKNGQNQTKIELCEDNKQEKPLDEHKSTSVSTSSPDLQPKLQTTKKDEDLKNCTSCLEGKMSAASYPTGHAKRAAGPLQLIHSDVCGPMPEPSWGEARYIVTFTGDYSRKTYGYVMKNKSETEGTRIEAAF